MKSKFYIICLLLSIVLIGCKIKTDYTLDEILKGASFVRNNNEYSMILSENSNYMFHFDKNNIKENVFITKYKENIVTYYYIDNYLKVNQCEYNNQEYFNCSSEEERHITNTIFTFDKFLSEMRITVNDLKVIEDELTTKIIYIDTSL